MKKTMVLTGLVLAGLLVPSGLFAAGRVELTITNNTRAVIASIKLVELANSQRVEEHAIRIEKGGSVTVPVKKNTSYKVVLVDTRDHKYERNTHTRNYDTALEMRMRDFVHESFGRTMDRAFRW